MNRFGSFISWGGRAAVDFLVAISGAAGARASLISMKSDWKRLSLFDE
jgi:hypothetical protein